MFYRHGDVNLHEVKAIPSTAKLIKKGRHTLAHGEATGSIHEIFTKGDEALNIYQDEDGTIYVHTIDEALVTHTHDHETLKVKPAIYKQVQEREVDHFADSIIRRVVD